jgi:hypothetical protein
MWVLQVVELAWWLGCDIWPESPYRKWKLRSMLTIRWRVGIDKEKCVTETTGVKWRVETW